MLGMKSGLNGVSMAVDVMEKALYSSYTRGQFLQPLNNPRAAMLEIKTSDWILPAQKCSAHATGCAVVVDRIGIRDQSFPWLSHVDSVKNWRDFRNL